MLLCQVLENFLLCGRSELHSQLCNLLPKQPERQSEICDAPVQGLKKQPEFTVLNQKVLVAELMDLVAA